MAESSSSPFFHPPKRSLADQSALTPFDPLVRFKGGLIDGYVAFYTTMSPNADKIEEALRPHWRGPKPL